MALSNILFGPAANLLGKKRLLVLADGELLSVPFAALPAPGGKAPIVVDHEVVNLLIISVLAHGRKDPATHQPATKTVLVVADPRSIRMPPTAGLQNCPEAAPNSCRWPGFCFPEMKPTPLHHRFLLHR